MILSYSGAVSEICWRRELDERDAKQIQLSVERLLKSWPQVQEKWGQRVDSIDLRYANGYAINIGKKL